MNAEQKDIRWEQRFSNFQKAFLKFVSAVTVVKENLEGLKTPSNESLHDILKEGLIQRFEYTHQLAWNVMKDYAEYQGNNDIGGSRDATREAFKMGLITDAEGWMDMIKSRNETSHTYNEETANAIILKIIYDYHPLFLEFGRKMSLLKSGHQQGLFENEL
jgi:nucleotidyltransferase substrate binding protein (TIGR01987 family)